MPLIPVPEAAGPRVWVERLAPHTWIVLDHWDSDTRQYVYHELDEPDATGRIGPSALETRYDPAGVRVVPSFPHPASQPPRAEPPRRRT